MSAVLLLGSGVVLFEVAAFLFGLSVALLLVWRHSRRRKETQLQGDGLERLKRRGVL